MYQEVTILCGLTNQDEEALGLSYLLQEMYKFPHALGVPRGTEDFLFERTLFVQLQQHHLVRSSDDIQFVVVNCEFIYRVFDIILVLTKENILSIVKPCVRLTLR